jgi:hypothetical protein
VGDDFDFDEGAEVDGGLGFSELDKVWGTASELLENGLSVTKDSAAKFLRVCDD